LNLLVYVKNALVDRHTLALFIQYCTVMTQTRVTQRVDHQKEKEAMLQLKISKLKRNRINDSIKNERHQNEVVNQIK